MKKPYAHNKKSSDTLRVALAGGGSGGPVAPLLALAEELRAHHDAEFLLIGTKRGPERQMAKWSNVPFAPIAAGKLRRYLSYKTIAAPFQSILGFFQARKLLKQFKADVVFAAGAFVSVPVGYAAWSLKIPIVIHQQDIVPSMSNKLLAPVADRITTTFHKSIHDFTIHSGLSFSARSAAEQNYEGDVVCTGNPVRADIMECTERATHDETYKQELRKKFCITNDWPVLFIFGGGTGAAGLNAIVAEALPELVLRFAVIHATGAHKGIQFEHAQYHPYTLVTNMAEAYAIADIVICRAGVGTISELSAAGKAAIVIPMPDSHQEENALYLHEHHAALVYAQPLLDGPRLQKIIATLLYDAEMQAILREHISKLMPHNAAQEIAKIILGIHQKRDDR